MSCVHDLMLDVCDPEIAFMRTTHDSRLCLDHAGLRIEITYCMTRLPQCCKYIRVTHAGLLPNYIKTATFLRRCFYKKVLRRVNVHINYYAFLTFNGALFMVMIAPRVMKCLLHMGGLQLRIAVKKRCNSHWHKCEACTLF